MQRVKNIYTGNHILGYDTKIVYLMKSRFEDLYSTKDDDNVNPDCGFGKALEVLNSKLIKFDSSSLDGDGFK